MATNIQNEADLLRARVLLSTEFSPSGPVKSQDLFSGRKNEIVTMLSAVSQPGQHVVLFGERGLGKTSLASLTHEFWARYAKGAEGLLPLRYGCAPSDTFVSIWSSISELMVDAYEKLGIALPKGDSWEEIFADVRNNNASPHIIRRLFDLANRRFVVVIDEFDQLEDQETTQLFANTIKTLSDNLIHATLIIVGVADTVDELISDYKSIERPLAQILLPRMTTEESAIIINRAYGVVGLQAAQAVIDYMARLAQGLPHYAHRLGQEAGFAATARGSYVVEQQDVEVAIKAAIKLTQETIRTAYLKATQSNQKNLHKEVLLACALTEGDELGYFAAGDIRPFLEQVAKKKYDIPQFAGHLRKFSSEERGPVLRMTGEHWKRQYRFLNPMMQSYIVLKGMEDKLIGPTTLNKIGRERRPSGVGEQRPLF